LPASAPGGDCAERGQSLAQLALGVGAARPAHDLALIGASSAEQVRENVRALDRLALSADELRAIGEFAVDAGIPVGKTGYRPACVISNKTSGTVCKTS